jgi:hypothetical protein
MSNDKSPPSTESPQPPAPAPARWLLVVVVVVVTFKQFWFPIWMNEPPVIFVILQLL